METEVIIAYTRLGNYIMGFVQEISKENDYPKYSIKPTNSNRKFSRTALTVPIEKLLVVREFNAKLDWGLPKYVMQAIAVKYERENNDEDESEEGFEDSESSE